MLIPVYGFDEETGLPLVPYIPLPSEQVPVPEYPEFDGVQMKQRGIDRWQYNQPSPALNERYTVSKETFAARNDVVLKMVDDWNAEAKRKGHKHARLHIQPGEEFLAVYLKTPTMDELYALKQQAREHYSWDQKQDEIYENHMKDVKRLLGEDYSDE